MYRYIGDTGILTYVVLGNLATIMVYLFNLFTFKKKKSFLGRRTECYIMHYSNPKHKILSKRNLWVFMEVALVAIGQYALAGMCTFWFGKFTEYGANYFGILFIIPVILHLCFYYLSVNPLKQMDMITPAFPLALIPVKLACFAHGCCGGFECSWGLYYPSAGTTSFPTQLLEIAQAVVLFIFLMKYRNKAKEGTLYPLYLTIYSATRFFIEFTADRTRDYLYIFNIYHILCAIGVVVGLLSLFVVTKWPKEIRDKFDRGFIFENGRCKRIKIKRK